MYRSQWEIADPKGLIAATVPASDSDRDVYVSLMTAMIGTMELSGAKRASPYAILTEAAAAIGWVCSSQVNGVLRTTRQDARTRIRLARRLRERIAKFGSVIHTAVHPSEYSRVAIKICRHVALSVFVHPVHILLRLRGRSLSDVICAGQSTIRSTTAEWLFKSATVGVMRLDDHTRISLSACLMVRAMALFHSLARAVPTLASSMGPVPWLGSPGIVSYALRLVLPRIPVSMIDRAIRSESAARAFVGLPLRASSVVSKDRPSSRGEARPQDPQVAIEEDHARSATLACVDAAKQGQQPGTIYAVCHHILGRAVAHAILIARFTEQVHKRRDCRSTGSTSASIGIPLQRVAGAMQAVAEIGTLDQLFQRAREALAVHCFKLVTGVKQGV